MKLKNKSNYYSFFYLSSETTTAAKIHGTHENVGTHSIRCCYRKVRSRPAWSSPSSSWSTSSPSTLTSDRCKCHSAEWSSILLNFSSSTCWCCLRLHAVWFFLFSTIVIKKWGFCLVMKINYLKIRYSNKNALLPCEKSQDQGYIDFESLSS